MFESEIIFHRPALAEKYFNFLTSADAASGLFLAAPRRTGKTTFRREDLIPLLKKNGATVICADLWTQKEKNPAIVISSAIAEAVLATDGLATKAVREIGLTKLKLAGTCRERNYRAVVAIKFRDNRQFKVCENHHKFITLTANI